MAHSIRSAVAAATAALLGTAGCTTLGPEYKAPVLDGVNAYGETAPAGSKEAKPLTDRWWELFNDPRLTELEQQGVLANPQLDSAAARVLQARAIARVTEADLLPQVSFDPSANRTRVSGNRPGQPGSPVKTYTASDFRVPLDAYYEIDFWGRLKRAKESAVARAEAEGDAFQTVLLGLQGDIAQNYFAIRAIDSDAAILRNTIEGRKQELVLVRARFKGGVTSELDVSRAEAELAATEADLVGLGKRRAELVNATAVLVGRLPGQFQLEEKPLDTSPPIVPMGLPSELLQRRPDVAQNERLLAARSAEIGIAQAAFFPSIRLTGGLGLESAQLSNLIKGGSAIWTLGGAASLPLFDGGRNEANLDRSKAAYQEALGQYRTRVLVAFQEVESALAGMRVLSDQIAAQRRSLASSKRTSELSITRYKAGLVTYLDVIDAERSMLANERLVSSLAAQRVTTAVGLIKALGGGWQGAQPVLGNRPAATEEPRAEVDGAALAAVAAASTTSAAAAAGDTDAGATRTDIAAARPGAAAGDQTSATPRSSAMPRNAPPRAAPGLNHPRL